MMTVTQKLPIDVYAHVLTPQFYQRMVAIVPGLPRRIQALANPALLDVTYRRQHRTVPTHQVVSMLDLNPENYVDPARATQLCTAANAELADLVTTHPDLFRGAVAMVPMNDVAGAQRIMADQVQTTPHLLGIQLFTRAMGHSVAARQFAPILATAQRLNLPIWLHPVLDDRKPDNNVLFSREYELTQAMHQLVAAHVFERFPKLKIIVHHAGAMVPFFAGRINTIGTDQQAADFRKFYVDTAILGNTGALKLACDYFGVDHVLFGTDAPFGVLPVGASSKIIVAIEHLPLSEAQKNQILYHNAVRLLGLK